VGVSKTLTIGANAIVLAQSGVPSSLKGGKTYFGTPSEDAATKKRIGMGKKNSRIMEKSNGISN
jgi:UDP-3-O-[3-hydroxymyristoyl] glucosamine N-acyltransferase